MLSTHRHYSSTRLPTQHETLSYDQVAEFDQWIDEELVRLETSFAEFVTVQSAGLESGDDAIRV